MIISTKRRPRKKNYAKFLIPNVEFPINVKIAEMPNDKNKYDLEERTAKFGEEIIKFCQSMPKNEIPRPIIGQLVDCGTAIGANYCEADNAESKKILGTRLESAKRNPGKPCIFCG